jgi:hypothetical protein
MIWWRLRNRVRELFWLPPLAPRTGEAVPPRPRLELLLERPLPGALVRLGPALLVVACGLLLGRIGPVGWVLTGAAALTLVWRPEWPIAAGFALLTGLWVYVGDDLLAVAPETGSVPGLWRASGLVLLVHALFVASALASHVSWRSLVETEVLWRVARSMVGPQAIVQTLLLLSGWLRASVRGGPPQDWLRLLGMIAVVGIVLLAVPAVVRRRTRDAQY